jgi:hypothetical protein
MGPVFAFMRRCDQFNLRLNLVFPFDLYLFRRKSHFSLLPLA